ncbi:MAG: hypothetical protein PHW61_00395 [Eubacteriales bacterium]|jgi:biotin operon repressor|nr:hypothetical protein [Eubacteriales bacterium]NCC69894.1 hypothetical protein [Clostridia bacterium]
MTDERVAAYLKNTCAGRKSTASSFSIEQELAISGNELRRRINRMRRKGVPIASSRAGYYYAVTAGEVYTTISQLRNMANGLEAAIRGLEESMEGFSEKSR